MKSFRTLTFSKKLVQNCRFLGTYKTSTGLVGLAVDPNGKENLITMSQNVLDSVTKIPECEYRTDVERWFNFIQKTAAEKTTIREIEDEIDLGQIEEVIDMAQEELKLIDYFYGWEVFARQQEHVAKIVEEMSDVIYYGNPPPPPPPPQKK